MEAGDEKSRLVFEALAYNISKHISALAPALVDERGELEIAAVILTGGMARSEELVNEIRRLTGHLGPMEVVAGEEEMAALAAGAEGALSGSIAVRQYDAEC